MHPTRRNGLIAPTVLGAGGLPAACASLAPQFAGQPGLQEQIISYYRSHASEKFESCPQVTIRSITRAQVVRETPDKVDMKIGYYWEPAQGIQPSRDTVNHSGRGTNAMCQGFGARTFMYTRVGNQLQVAGISGVNP